MKRQVADHYYQPVVVGPLSLAGILFIALKLTGHIDWSWVWVLCPFWALPALFASIFAVAAGSVAALWAIYGIADVICRWRAK